MKINKLESLVQLKENKIRNLEYNIKGNNRYKDVIYILKIEYILKIN